jgi:hypothetical protein
MDNGGRFHRKKIAGACVTFFSGRKRCVLDRAKRQKCSEKDTSRNKLLQCGAHFYGNVMYFAGDSSKAIGN